MRAKLLIVVLVFMTVLPALSHLGDRNLTSNNSFVALAGHTGFGNYCEDGTPGCLPGDPGALRSANPARKDASNHSQFSGAGSNVTGMLVASELLRWIVSRF